LVVVHLLGRHEEELEHGGRVSKHLAHESAPYGGVNPGVTALLLCSLHEEHGEQLDHHDVKSPSTRQSLSTESARQICASSCHGAGLTQNRRMAWRISSRSYPAPGASTAVSDWIFLWSIWVEKKRRSVGGGGSGAARREVVTAHACGDRCRVRSHWLVARREVRCASCLSCVKYRRLPRAREEAGRREIIEEKAR
jgi:hypothetical protein